MKAVKAFAVRWEPFERRGQVYLSGYIVSSYGVTATRVQLLVDSLDSSGQIVAQRVEWLASPPCISAMPQASSLRLKVPIGALLIPTSPEALRCLNSPRRATDVISLSVLWTRRV